MVFTVRLTDKIRKLLCATGAAPISLWKRPLAHAFVQIMAVSNSLYLSQIPSHFLHRRIHFYVTGSLADIRLSFRPIVVVNGV